MNEDNNEKKDLKKIYHWDDEKIINEKEEIKEIQRVKKKALKNQPKHKAVQETKKGLTKTAKILISVVSVIVVLAVAAGVVFGYFGYRFDFSKTLATVNGARIKQNTLDTYVEFLKNQDSTSVPAENTPEFKTFQVNILDSLIVLKVLENYADKNNFKVTQKEIDDAYQEIVKSYPSESDFEKYLVAKKISKDFLMDQVSSQVLRDKIFADVTKNITISDAEVKQYYDDNKETLYKVPEQIQVNHILIIFNVPEGQELTEQLKKEANDKIKAVQEKLKSGEDFAALAKSYSEDTASKDNGGDIGLISAGQTIKEFEDAAFALKVGEVSDIVETTYGYHLIKVTDRKDEYIKDFSEVTDTIKSYLLNSMQTGEWEKFVSDLILKTNIKYTT
ncbi:MAG: peptidylprolyl isomerase, partial [Actinobacteria bacterium]|nr:peptidylprolyl isomerase [Actinomycetota bacterium]